MVHAAESIEIDAEPEAVFAFLDEPANHATITPALGRIANVESLENGGKELDYTYEMVGVPIAGHLTQTVHEPPTRHVFVMDSGLSGELGFRIEPSGRGSRVQYHATYEIPGRLRHLRDSGTIARAGRRARGPPVQRTTASGDAGEPHERARGRRVGRAIGSHPDCFFPRTWTTSHGDPTGPCSTAS